MLLGLLTKSGLLSESVKPKKPVDLTILKKEQDIFAEGTDDGDDDSDEDDDNDDLDDLIDDTELADEPSIDDEDDDDEDDDGTVTYFCSQFFYT